MRLVMLSTDLNILKTGPVRDRVLSYGTIVESLTLVVIGGTGEQFTIEPNVVIRTTGGASKMTQALNAFRLLMGLVTKKTCDLISVQDPFFLGFIALCVASMRNVPLQVQVHTDFFSPHFQFESAKRFIESVVARMVLWGASCVRVVSLRILRSVQKYTDRPVSVLPISVQMPTSVPEKPKEFTDAFTVVTVSRLTHEKNIDLLIDAVALLPRVHLIIVGDGPERKRLESIRARKGLFDRVTFVGWQQDASPYVAHAGCYAQVSLYEGYGLSLVEASLRGIPSLSTDVGVVGELLERGKDVLVVARTPHSVANAITEFEEKPALRLEMGARAKARVVSQLTSREEYLASYKKALMSCVS